MRVSQLLLVILEPANLDRSIREKAMTKRRISARNARERKLDDLAVECADDPMQWPHPARLSRRPPTHGFGPWQLCDRFGQHFAQHLGRLMSLSRDHRDIEFALAVVTRFAFLARHACGAKKAVDRL